MFKVLCAALGAAVLLSPGLISAAPAAGGPPGAPRVCSPASRPACPGGAAASCTAAGVWSCPAPGLTEAACRGYAGPACPSPTIMECHNGHWICVGPAQAN